MLREKLKMASVAAATSAVADLLQRSEALLDGKKINEAIDILNTLGRCRAVALHLRNSAYKVSVFYLAHTTHTVWCTSLHSGCGGGGRRERGGGENQRASYSPSWKGSCQAWLCRRYAHTHTHTHTHTLL